MSQDNRDDRRNYKRENLYTVIVVFNEGGRSQFYKVHKVEADKPAVWTRFEKFVKGKFADKLSHANLYGGVTKKFARQVDFKKK